jgi:hypothetical protein
MSKYTSVLLYGAVASLDYDDCQLTSVFLGFQVCEAHLQPPLLALSHYKAVCRALVAETVELAMFLEKMACTQDEVDEPTVLMSCN